MIRSMTGFARADAQGAWGWLHWELRSVNHRYLDLQFKLPEEARGLEAELRQTAAESVSRGKFEAALRVQPASSADATEVDTGALDRLCEAVHTVTRHLRTAAAPDPVRVLSFPGVLKRPAMDLDPLLQAARSSFSEALQAFTDMRAREGRRLESYLSERCDGLLQLAQATRERFSQVRPTWLDRLRARAAELGVELDPARVEQELVLALQRLDVDEEVARLGSHIAEVRGALGRKEPVGRRLDFLTQELNREVNTLSSKSQDAEITRIAVEMKVLVEQIREQVQNIE